MRITMYILFLSVQNAHQAHYSSHMPWRCSGKICCPWSIRQQDFNVGSSNEFREGHFYPYLERRISGTIKLKLEFFNDTIFIIYSIPILSLFQICLGKCISCLCSYIIIIIWMDDQISKAWSFWEKISCFRVTSRAATSLKEMCLSAW